MILLKSIMLLLSLLIFSEMNDTYTLTDFTQDDPRWYIVNDGVMGGLSESQLQLTDQGTAIFQGKVSLENNGGFASSRMPLREEAPKDFETLRLRIKGDGNRYNFRIRKDRRFDGLAYDQEFDTKKDEWIEVDLPLSRFIGTFRGRKFQDRIGVSSDDIGQIGILIANKQEGAFSIELDWIKLVSLSDEKIH